MQLIKRYINGIINIADKCFFLIFGLFLISSLFIVAQYNYLDFPFFHFVTLGNILSMTLIISFTFLLIYFVNSTSDKIRFGIYGLFLLAGILYFMLVPLKPFSDMKLISDGAIAFSQFNLDYYRGSEYFSMFPFQIITSIFYGLFYLLLPKETWVINLVNIFVVIYSAEIAYRLLKLWLPKIKNSFSVYFLSFLALLLYVNHIYSDLIFLASTLTGVYLYLKSNHKDLIMPIICFGIAYLFRATSVIFVIAIILDYFLNQESLKIFLISILRSLAPFVITVILISNVVYPMFVIKNPMPIWSFISIGMNEEEFGFMNGGNDITKNFNSVLTTIKEYTPTRFVSMLIKKSYWVWTEGTYQAGRYGFGSNIDSKYLYETSATKHLYDSGQLGRQAIDLLMRSQYILAAYFAFYFAYFQRKNNKDFNFIKLLFYGFFCFYLIWEIKSRYLLPLFPYLIFMSYLGMMNIKNKRGIQNEY